MSVRAYVALGSNLGDPQATVRAACTALHALPETTLAAASSLYRSAPVGLKNQPDFINAVAALDTRLAAEALLDELFAIEARFGRKREFRHAPRTLDLDLLLYGAETRATTRLALPHPRMHERAFVLLPLVEIAPAAAIPGRGPAATLLDGVRGQVLARLDPVEAS
ncbi:MAG: 2-amino-4-hydroxy-6-hydroxymethyldihydropteridine diphosphokinase [Burkholderiales bacterium]|jgi:2-amino-4-hydroxy-6-hydroxymethyldihydropteridine diphosphokinase|nr:2-amino-4-hydroxy-6-hydroxymethyldihydropteridine diphosphokinase [Rhodocyclaceae bacterium]MCZ2173474.1 2-amino-4-hydroxy-6-hydroxymethyldihydropteridine diphosphokinase [Burkholderiales bacterium]OQY72228.1 MAG: 2-amino-4-hydroxy-6-hydroxymethyldihydropteridine diphosphokinase [Rhodocyclaceae bacterium UTPRO2]HNQ57236.1 2-amino-4-hydroxy-6-hydroxymethyldihydropteridine diphosphokinase [Candidatus Desulfobacillus denitrificans]MBV6409956.1 2-amino-4-hydroxy-6-hydroxymethyldihydropteridine p